MEDYSFQRVALPVVECLRQMQTLDLKGQVYDPLEEQIGLAEPTCLKIQSNGKDVGYALLDEKAKDGFTLLEYYLVPGHRNDSKPVLNELVRSFHCRYWFVNSQDSFALPLLLECGISYELDAYIFSVEGLRLEIEELPDGISLGLATPDDLDSTYNLIMQDGFYTGNGLKGLAVRIRNEEIYLLRSRGLLGVGFVCPLVRTPRYADVAMIIDGKQRRQGLASHLVSQLIRISLDKGLIPTALTSPKNIASRKTLEKCGFHLDGCMLYAKTFELDRSKI